MFGLPSGLGSINRSPERGRDVSSKTSFPKTPMRRRIGRTYVIHSARVVLLDICAGEALEGVDVVHSHCGLVCSHQQVLSPRMKLHSPYAAGLREGP